MAYDVNYERDTCTCIFIWHAVKSYRYSKYTCTHGLADQLMSIHFRNPLPVKKYDRENKLYIAESTSLDGSKTEYTDKSGACFHQRKCKMKCISRCKMDV